MAHYAKLFDCIIHSTIWQEPLHVKVVWVTMLAMADFHGEVAASVPGLAKAAGVTIEQCEEALSCFLSPDPYSRSPEAEGRRLEVIPGGWELINYVKYKELKSEDQKREQSAERSRRYRERHAISHASSREVTPDHTESLRITTDRDKDIYKNTTTPTPSAPVGEKKKRTAKAQKLAGYHPEVVGMVKRLLALWPSERIDGSKVRNDDVDSCSAVESIMVGFPDVTLSDLEAIALGWLDTKPAFPNALQFWFGKGKPGIEPPWRKEFRALLTRRAS